MNYGSLHRIGEIDELPGIYSEINAGNLNLSKREGYGNVTLFIYFKTSCAKELSCFLYPTTAQGIGPDLLWEINTAGGYWALSCTFRVILTTHALGKKRTELAMI